MIWNNGDIITENKYNRLKRFGGNYPQSIKLEVITDGINVQQPYINMSYDQLLNLVKDGNIIYITITEVTQEHTYTNIFYLMYLYNRTATFVLNKYNSSMYFVETITQNGDYVLVKETETAD